MVDFVRAWIGRLRSSSLSGVLDRVDLLKVGRLLLVYLVAAAAVGWMQGQFHPLLWQIGLGVLVVELGRRWLADHGVSV